jgi:hypothetical protein
VAEAVVVVVVVAAVVVEVAAVVVEEAAVEADGDISQFGNSDLRKFRTLQELENSGALKQWPVDMAGILEWLRHLICAPHLATGHERPVCGCALEALGANRVFLEHIALDSQHDSIILRDDLAIALLNAAAMFREQTSAEEYSLDCILLTLSGLQDHQYRYVIDGAYEDSKPRILEQKLMIGGFHPYNNRTSAYNPHFHPMRPPDPVFAIRHMNCNDWKSLREDERYLTIYRKFYPMPFSES